MEKPVFHSSVVCSPCVTILKYNNRLEDDYELGNGLGAGYAVVRLNSELLLQRSIYRTEQGIKWTSDDKEGVIHIQQEDCGERVPVVE